MSKTDANKIRTRAAFGLLRHLVWRHEYDEKQRREAYEKYGCYWASEWKTSAVINRLLDERLPENPNAKTATLKEKLPSERITRTTLERISSIIPSFGTTYTYGPEDSFLWQSLWAPQTKKDPVMEKLRLVSNHGYDEILKLEGHDVVAWLDSFPHHTLLLFSALIQVARRGFHPSKERGTEAAIRKTLEIAEFFHIKHRLQSVYGLNPKDLLLSSDFIPNGWAYELNVEAIPLLPRTADVGTEIVGYGDNGEAIVSRFTPDQLVTFESAFEDDYIEWGYE